MNDRCDFASNLDGTFCLIAPVGAMDWEQWEVESVAADNSRKRILPKRGFDGVVQTDAEASWPLEYLCHVEISIPGLDRFLIHPRQGLWCPQEICPVCGWNAKDARREHAEKLARAAHEIVTQKTALGQRAKDLVNVAREKADKSQYQTALTILDTALEMYRSTGNAAAYADTLLEAGEAKLRFGLSTEALDTIQEARLIFEQIGSMRGLASATKLLADTLSDLGAFDQSIDLYNEAQGRFRQLADQEMVVTIDMELGVVIQRTGRSREAREHYEEALRQFQAMARQRNLDVARCQQNFSSTLVKLGELEQAQASLREARAIYVELGRVRQIADCDVNLGNALWSQGRLTEARELNEAAMRVYRELELPTESADCADHLGAMLAEEGNYEAALPYHLHARATYDEYYFAIDSALASYNYAHALHHLGRYQEADAELERAMHVFASHKSESNLALAEGLRASVLASLGRHTEALNFIQSSRERWHSLDNVEVPPEFDTIEGEVLRQAGRPRDAVPFLERAIAACVESENAIGAAEAEIELALALQDLNDPDAKTHANRAREIFQAYNLPLRAKDVPELTGDK